jgi:hypothetical protein
VEDAKNSTPPFHLVLPTGSGAKNVKKWPFAMNVLPAKNVADHVAKHPNATTVVRTFSRIQCVGNTYVTIVAM